MLALSRKITVGIWSSTGVTGPRLDSIRGRRGDRDGRASKITKQSSVCRPTVPRPSRPSRTQTQTQTGPKREGDRKCPSCRMHVEIACPSHNVSEPLIHKPRFSPTLTATRTHTHTHTLSHCWPGTAATAAARFSRISLRSIPLWHSPMERRPSPSPALSPLFSLPSSTTPFAPHMSATVETETRNLQSEITLLVQPI